jgi:uncharacterized protein
MVFTKKSREKVRKHFDEVIRIKTNPKEIAQGFALGTLIAVLPTFGLGVFIGFGFLLIFKKLSKIGMLISFLIFNPIVLAGIYSLSFIIGDLIFKDIPIMIIDFTFFEKLFYYSRRFLVGNLILAVTISFLSYWIVYWIVKIYQENEKLIS